MFECGGGGVKYAKLLVPQTARAAVVISRWGGGAYLGKGDQVNEKLLSVTTVPEIRKEKRDTLSGFRKITMITYNLLHFTAAR